MTNNLDDLKNHIANMLQLSKGIILKPLNRPICIAIRLFSNYTL